jgi:hypothetical protein
MLKFCANLMKKGITQHLILLSQEQRKNASAELQEIRK